MTDISALISINQRVWFVEGGVHPLRSPELLTIGKFSNDPSQKMGDAKKITAPDPNNFNNDIQVGSVPGSVDRASLSIAVRSTVQKSILMGWKNKKCRVDLFALSGRCGNPSDFTDGAEKWIFFPDGRLSGHGYEGFGAFGLDEAKETNENVDMTSEEYIELLAMSEEQVGSSVTARQVYTVDVYVGNACEACPDPCDRVLCTMAGASATPGTQPILLYSSDAGNNWSQQTISTLFSNEVINDGECIGDCIVYVSNTSNSLHYTEIEDLYLGVNTWKEVISGFVAGKGPNAILDVDSRHIWIVGDGGYVYFSSNFHSGVVVMDAGVATTQSLKGVHAYDTKNILAVGGNNAVIHSLDGGETWKSEVGPSAGIMLSTCWMWDKATWLVGEGGGGNGKLWLTVNSGKTWTEIVLPGVYVQIDKIRFVSDAEGYLSARDAGKSYLLRTITAGNEWVVLPQGKKASVVNNTFLADIAVCSKYMNTAFAAGLASNGTSGIIVKSVGA